MTETHDDHGPYWLDKKLREAESEPLQSGPAPRFNILIAPDCPKEVGVSTVPPFCAVGQLVSEKPSTHHGKSTAFAIGGNFIMTAAHCICPHGTTDKAEYAKNFVFVPGAFVQNDKMTNHAGEWAMKAGTEPMIMEGWLKPSTDRPTRFDVAIIELETRKGKSVADAVGAFRLKFEMDWAAGHVGNFALDAIGYPRESTGCTFIHGAQYIQRGSFLRKTHGVLYRHGKMGTGSSGGPWVNSEVMVPHGGVASTYPEVYGLTSYSRHDGENHSPAFGTRVKRFVEGIVG